MSARGYWAEGQRVFSALVRAMSDAGRQAARGDLRALYRFLTDSPEVSEWLRAVVPFTERRRLRRRRAFQQLRNKYGHAYALSARECNYFIQLGARNEAERAAAAAAEASQADSSFSLSFDQSGTSLSLSATSEVDSARINTLQDELERLKREMAIFMGKAPAEDETPAKLATPPPAPIPPPRLAEPRAVPFRLRRASSNSPASASKPPAASLADVIRGAQRSGLRSRLRRVDGQQRSPGGTPVRSRPAADTGNSQQDVIARALRKKFASMPSGLDTTAAAASPTSVGSPSPIPLDSRARSRLASTSNTASPQTAVVEPPVLSPFSTPPLKSNNFTPSKILSPSSPAPSLELFKENEDF